MTDLFKEIIPSVLQTKENLLDSEEAQKAYNPYVVNKALSHHMDCVMYSNMMNMSFNLHNKAQYDYLINSIRAKKRPYTKWYKPEKEDDLVAVKMFFGYSDRKAREALKLLTDEQVKIIKTKTKIGD